MSDPGLPDLPDPSEQPPGGDPGSVPAQPDTTPAPEAPDTDLPEDDDDIEGLPDGVDA